MFDVLFHIRPRPGLDAEAYEAEFVHMVELVSQIPGFVSIDGFAGEDGSELAVARFETEEAIRIWRNQPDHVQTRERGRREFFAAYDITIAEEMHHYDWSLERDGVELSASGRQRLAEPGFLGPRRVATASARDDQWATGAQWRGRSLLPVTEADEATLRRFYDELMVPAFPPAELMSLESLRAAQPGGGVGGWLVLAGADPVAGMVTEDCVDGHVLLLSYLVVANHLRGQGVGRLLVDDLLAAGRARDMLVLAEIEDPREFPREPGNDPLARLRFYSRAGARRLPLAYAQPSLRPGSPRVPGLLLIVLGQTGDAVESGLVVDFLDEYYATCEGPEVLTTDEPYAALRRAAAGRNGVLPLLDLDQLTRPERSHRAGPDSPDGVSDRRPGALYA